MKRSLVVGIVVSIVLLLGMLGSAAAQGPQPPPPTPLPERGPGGEPVTPDGSEGITAAVGSSFTYQGQLRQANAPVNGACDMAFRLYDALSVGNQIGSAITSTVIVTNGLFTVNLSFGASAFQGDARWLDITVRCPNGSGSYTTLTPRQPLYAAPYAMSLMPFATISATSGSSAGLFRVDNYGAGRAAYFTNRSNSTWAVRADNLGNSGAFYATTLDGEGVYADSTYGTGVVGSHGAVTGTTPGVQGRTYSGDANAVGVLGEVLDSTPGGSSAAVRGINNGTAGSGIGVWGSQAGSGWGVYGESPTGRGVYGNSADGTGVRGSSSTGIGVYAYSNGVGIGNPALYAYNPHTGAEPNGIAIYAQNASSDATIVARNTSTGDTFRSLNAAGTNIIYRVTSTGRVVASAVQIYGGGDLAEKFAVKNHKAIEPGTLLVIDPDHPGALMISTSAYDGKVAGVVSGAQGVEPGLTLHQDKVLDGDTVVAIAGRVYVKADASYGSIKPGDLLTTSDTPGHAMKAGDRDKAYGAVIGKAMTGLERGTGYVLVLVNLQ